MTTIHVDENTWKKLNALKNPGESMNDVIRKILNYFEKVKSEMKTSKLNPDVFTKKLDEFCMIASEGIAEIVEGTRLSFKKVMEE